MYFPHSCAFEWNENIVCCYARLINFVLLNLESMLYILNRYFMGGKEQQWSILQFKS